MACGQPLTSEFVLHRTISEYYVLKIWNDDLADNEELKKESNSIGRRYVILLAPSAIFQQEFVPRMFLPQEWGTHDEKGQREKVTTKINKRDQSTSMWRGLMGGAMLMVFQGIPNIFFPQTIKYISKYMCHASWVRTQPNTTAMRALVYSSLTRW